VPSSDSSDGDDGHALPLGGAKPRGVLAMLALHANVDQLWVR
jgi:hypothetical protein